MFQIMTLGPIVIESFIQKTVCNGLIAVDIKLILIDIHLIVVDFDEVSVDVRFTLIYIQPTISI